MTPRIEVPVVRSLDVIAPQLKVAVLKVLAKMKEDGFNAIPFDTLRTADRQSFLYGKGRTPEQCIEMGVDPKWAWPTCPDGRVTKAASYLTSWHGFGLAVDIVENDATPWTAPQAFWHALGRHAMAQGLAWGGGWSRFPDLPHVQWGRTPMSPTPLDRALLQQDVMAVVWAKYHAD